MKPTTRFLPTVVTARLIVALGSMLALTVPASAGSMMVAKDTENNDRSADMRAIYAIEDRAEAIAEGEKTGNAAIVAARESIAKWRSLRTTLAQKGASGRTLVQMDTSIKELARTLNDSRTIERAANDVTGALAPLFAVVGESIPADVHSLDYLGRSISLDATMAQWGRAGHDAYALDRAWLRLKPLVATKKNGRKVVVMFDAAVRRARDGAHDRDSEEAQTGATAVGNAVDAVEGLYT